MSFTNYAGASEHLLGGRNKDYRPLTGRSTSLERRGPTTIAVHYHETDVVTFHEDGPTVLNSDGWRTLATKDRMNKYSAANLLQSKGLWYVGDTPWNKEGQSVLYFDSIEVSDSGVVANPPDAGETEQFEKAKKQIDRQVSAYIKGFSSTCGNLAKSTQIPAAIAGTVGCEQRAANRWVMCCSAKITCYRTYPNRTMYRRSYSMLWPSVDMAAASRSSLA